MANYEIKNGYLYIDGKQVPYKASPNVGGTCKPEILVCHDTASGLNDDGPISWLCNPSAKASAHFVVGRGGEITQLVPCNRTAWHAGKSVYKGRNVAGSVNSFAVGIEIVNPGIMTDVQGGKAFFSNGKRNVGWDMKEYGIEKAAPLPLSLKRAEAYWMSYTDEQLEAVLGIGQAVKKAYNISDVVAHWTVSPGRKVDTNPLFPLEEMKEAILKGTDMVKKNKTTKTVVKTPATPTKTVETKDTKAGKMTKIEDGDASTTIIDPNKGKSGTADAAGDSVEEQTGMRAPVINDDNLVNETRERIARQEEEAKQALEEQRIKDEKERQEEIDNTTGVVKKTEQEEAVGTGLVKMDLNLRPWPDSPSVIAVIRVGTTVEYIRETTSQVTKSKWYKVRVAVGDTNAPGKKGQTYTGFVHSSYLDVTLTA